MHLILETGQVFHGQAFGHDPEDQVTGEVVFQTGMVGYPESLTDPSYHSQILVLTYPIIGNYGVPDFQKRDQFNLPIGFESSRIHPIALIVGEAVDQYSHFTATQSLDQWLKSQKIPGLQGVDTRALTKVLREHGTVRAQLSKTIQPQKWNPTPTDLVQQVSTTEIQAFEPIKSKTPPKTVLIIDCGIKAQQIRMFLQRNCRVILVPWNYDFLKATFDFLFISNGPGNPEDCQIVIERLRSYFELSQMKPVFGICLGHQLISLAAGARTYKMKYGNRGHNLPCQLTDSQRCFITSQNHGYAVDPESLDSTYWKPLFTNLNDHSNEGIIHRSKPIFSVQFHPEAKPGPQDTEFLFDYFLDQKLNLLRFPTDKLTNIPSPQKILILGSGGLSIGQSGEFDYSGSQAIKAYREAGITTILINPNIATVQTSTDFVDKIYSVPITLEWVTKVIELEHPDSITVSFGGQTALNTGLALETAGILEKYNIRVLGTPLASVRLTEDRQLFKERLEALGQPTIPSKSATNLKDSIAVAESIGYPVLVRAAFALGGLGSGFANNESELIPLLKKAFAFSEQVIIDRSFRGWKEIEYEVVRDQYNNCICVCNMENLDPLGIHTGESIVVAPSQTLDDHDYQMLRSTAIKVISNLEIVGECNIQFALDPGPRAELSSESSVGLRPTGLSEDKLICPKDKPVGDPTSRQYYIIEVNARLSRSSALASKATGYPLAYVAAKLSLGHSLAELENQVTLNDMAGHTTACFEPSLDYCVVKVPRWDLDKFPLAERQLDSAMKSIGEAMGIGRSFEEAFQKALRMANDNVLGFYPDESIKDSDKIRSALENATDQRMRYLATFMYNRSTIDKFDRTDSLYQLTRIDPWFLGKLERIIECHRKLPSAMYTICMGGELPITIMSSVTLREAKQLGFSDRQIAKIVETTELAIRNHRHKAGIYPVAKQIDTVAGEFPCQTNYLYLTYAVGQVQTSETLPLETLPLETSLPGFQSDVKFEDQDIMVLGSGVYKIGSSVEFDWCAVNCIRELRDQGQSTIMVNCNPETVSTDYDEADKLYFEELSFETVMDIYQMEKPRRGVVLSMGGQIPNNIAIALHRQNVPIVGTSPEMIDQAENRYKFSRLLDKLNIDQPQWRDLTSIEAAIEFCHQVEYPCLIRPSYVLSGAAMNVAYSDEDLLEYLNTATAVSKDHPVVISKYILEAKEIEVDAVAQHGRLLISAISEHVENAGVHSGDATLIHPAQYLTDETRTRIDVIVRAIAESLAINGPFNMQFLAKDDHIKVIECNLRVSRTFPFVSKTQDLNLVRLATQAMLGLAIQTNQTKSPIYNRIGVKVPTFSFSRLKGADFQLGVDMVSTGEVACFGRTPAEAYWKGIQASPIRLPTPGQNILLSIGAYKHKNEFLASAQQLSDLGYKLYGTGGTCDFLLEKGLTITELPIRQQGAVHGERQVDNLAHRSQTTQTSIRSSANRENLLDYLADKRFGLVINTSRQNKILNEGQLRRQRQASGYLIRRTAIDNGVPLITDIKTAKFLVKALTYGFVNRLPNITVETHIDCLTNQQLIRLPGLIDVHVHLREPGGESKEDWSSGTQSALAGGITQVCAMPNTNPAITDLVSFELVSEIARTKAHCDYAIFVGANSQNLETVSELAPAAAGLKMYLNQTYGTLKLEKTTDWLTHLSNWKHTKRPVCVHAEGQTLAAVLHLANLSQCPIHVCHVSSREEIEIIKASKLAGQAVTCEVTPHHLFLTNTHIPEPYSSVKPPLMTEDDQAALWENLEYIDCFATDHAPHLKADKCAAKCPGFPGLESALPLLLTAVKQGRLSLDDIILRYHTNPRRIFDLPVQPETYIEVDLNCKWTLPDQPVFSKADWSPFAGTKVIGKVQRVVLRGQLVYLDGNILSQPGFGQNLRSMPVDQPKMHSIDQSKVPQVLQAPQIKITSIGSGLSIELPGKHNPIQQSNPLQKLKNLISVEQMNRDMLKYLFDRSDQLRQLIEIHGTLSILNHRILGLLFYEPSTRTRASFAAAMKRLGGQVIEILADHNSSTAKGESFSDTIQTMFSYTDALVVRSTVSLTDTLKNYPTTMSLKPIINAGDNIGEHPTQALLDVYTIRRERGSLTGLSIALVGDLKYGRTVHSLAKLLALYQVRLFYFSPADQPMPKSVIKYIDQYRIEQVQLPLTELETHIGRIDVLYLTRPQRERHTQVSHSTYQIDASLLAKAKSDICIMHPLPRTQEINPEIDNDPRVAYFRQMENGMYLRMSLLESMLA